MVLVDHCFLFKLSGSCYPQFVLPCVTEDHSKVTSQIESTWTILDRYPRQVEDTALGDRRHCLPVAMTIVLLLMLQVKLVQHTYSCLYGTFLGNSPCEREMHNIYKRTCSVWSLLRAGNKNFHNLLYMPGSEQVSRAPGLVFWALCLPSTGDCIKREWRGFLLCSSLNIAIVAGAASSVPCPSTACLDSSISPSFLPTSSGTG